MAGYVEEIAGYEFTDKGGTRTGQRVFRADPNGALSLPAIGDPFPINTDVFDDPGDCVLFDIKEQHWQEQASQWMYTCRYSTVPFESQPPEQDPSTEFGELETSYSSSGQMITLGGTPTFSASAEELGKPFAKFQPIISMTILKHFTEEDALRQRLIDYGGKLNNDVFKGQASNLWFFSSSRVSPFINSLGNEEFKAYLTFEIKVPPIDWNFEWDPSVQAFRALSVNRYTTADFSAGGLFAFG